MDINNLFTRRWNHGVGIRLEHDGTDVSGTAELQLVDGVEISDGVYEDGVLSFLMHVGLEGQWFTVEMEADVDGDEMSGRPTCPTWGWPCLSRRRGRAADLRSYSDRDDRSRNFCGLLTA